MNAPETETPLPPRIEYGRFGSRMFASTLDMGLILLVALPLVQFLMNRLFPPIDFNSVAAIIGPPEVRSNPYKLYPAVWRVIREQHILQRALAQNLMQVAFIGVYVLPFWLRYSATPGKMLMGLRIRDMQSGEPMTPRQCVIRFLGYFVSGLPLCLGFIWIFLNKKRRGFHDFIAGTVVTVKPKKYKLPLL
jgi:uncharacterized RDD family membrane protein YckC